MVKSKNWSLYSKPTEPYKPYEPQKEIINIGFLEIFRHAGECDDCKLSDISLPIGVELKDLIIRIENDFGVMYIVIGTNKEIKRPNPYYEIQLKTYKENLRKYEKEMANYKTVLKDWKDWCKQEKEKQLQDQLKKAENLLKKHGKLKTT